MSKIERSNLIVLLLAVITVIAGCGEGDSNESPGNSRDSTVCGKYSGWQGGPDTWIESRSQLKALHESGCTDVEGSLRVYFIPGVSDLSLLENIESVGVAIEIGYTQDLTSLKGLESVQSYRFLSLVQNDALEDTTALQVPQQSTDGRNFSVTVSTNRSLRSFGGLDGIVNVPFVNLTGNPELREIPALEDAYSDPEYDSFVSFRAERNPKLPTCKIERLLSRVDSDRRQSVIEGNDDDATCP